MSKDSPKHSYTLHISEAQASLLCEALDLYMRIGMGQFGVVLDRWRFRCPVEAIEPAQAAPDHQRRHRAMLDHQPRRGDRCPRNVAK